MLLLFAIFDSNREESSVFIVANNNEKECLINWKSKDRNVAYIKEHQLLGPELYEGNVILEFGGYPSNTSFQYEFSSCFSDSFIWAHSLSELETAIDFLEKKSRYVGFYKSTDSSKILVYGVN